MASGCSSLIIAFAYPCNHEAVTPGKHDFVAVPFAMCQSNSFMLSHLNIESPIKHIFFSDLFCQRNYVVKCRYLGVYIPQLNVLYFYRCFRN